MVDCVFGYSPNNILFGVGLIITLTNNQYTIDCSLYGKQLGSMTKLWGPDPSRLYIAATNGWVALKQASTYTNMTTGTTRDLTDIYGNQHEIWAVGGYSNKNEGVVLLNKGSGWEKMNSISENEQRSIHSVWCDEKGLTEDGFVIFAGRGIWYKDTTWKTPPSKMLGGNLGLGTLFFNSVRGSGRNEVIAAGHFGIVLHYNGSNWQWYPELFNYPQNRFLSEVGMTKNNIFIVGEENDRGIIIHGKRR